MDEYIDSKEVFYSILDALECKSRIGKGWRMWNDKPVDCQFRTKIKPDRVKPVFTNYTCRVLGSMLCQALGLEFGEKFFPSTPKEEKDYYREPREKSDIAVQTRQSKHYRVNNKEILDHLPESSYHMKRDYMIWWNSKKDYIDANYVYIINLVETMRKLCNCNNDKYSESRIILKTLMTHIRSVYHFSDEYNPIQEKFKAVTLTEDINMFIYTFFMYYMRDVAYDKNYIPFKETNELLFKILLSTPFYITIYTNLSNKCLPEYFLGLKDLEYNGKKLLSKLADDNSYNFSLKSIKKLKEEAEKTGSEVQYNFQHLNDLMEKINEFIINKGGEVNKDELEKYINEMDLDFITNSKNKVDLVDELISYALLGTRTKIVVNDICISKRSKIILQIANGIRDHYDDSDRDD